MSEATLETPLEMAAGQIAASYLHTAEAQTKIAEVVRGTVDKAIKESLGPYGDVGKQITEAVGKALQLYGDLDIPSYNDLLLKIIAAQVEHATKDAIERQVAERITVLLEPIPQTIKLSDLVKQYVDYLKDQEDAGCVCYGERKEITFHLTEERDTGFRDICLDPEAGKSTRDCEIRVGIYKGEMYHLHFRHEEVERRMFTGPFYGFQRSLFQMKAAKTQVVLDHKEVDIETDYTPDHDD